ncbi:flagellar export chaperone FliS [Paenibacillus sp. CMM36]
MINSPYQKYQQAQLQTASPGQLLLMLYDGAIRFIRAGIKGIEETNHEKANTNLCKAQAVINELIAALNHDFPISSTLYQVYEYMLHQLINANLKKKCSTCGRSHFSFNRIKGCLGYSYKITKS